MKTGWDKNTYDLPTSRLINIQLFIYGVTNLLILKVIQRWRRRRNTRLRSV